jgi:hypothetical protein
MDEKLFKEMEIVKQTNRNVRNEKFPNKFTVDSVISRQDQEEERILGMENKIKRILCLDNNKEKTNSYDYNLQEL